MKIYLDLIMILNFFIDFILLLTVSVILKRNIKITRIMLGAFIGGISILLLFFNINSVLLFVLKFLISVAMTIITFKFVNIKYTLVNILYYIFINILTTNTIYLY